MTNRLFSLVGALIVAAVGLLALSMTVGPNVALAWNYSIRCQDGEVIGTVTFPPGKSGSGDAFYVILQQRFSGSFSYSDVGGTTNVPGTGNRTAQYIDPMFGQTVASFTLTTAYVDEDAAYLRVRNTKTSEKSGKIAPCFAPTPTPTPTPSPTPTPTPTATPTPTSTPASTPTPTPTPVDPEVLGVSFGPRALPDTGGEGASGGPAADAALALLGLAMLGTGAATVVAVSRRRIRD